MERMATSTDIDEAAARWVARRASGSWSVTDEAAFNAWLTESALHEVAFLRLEAVWVETDRLRALSGTVDVDTSLAAKAGRGFAWWRWVAAPTAAIALFVIAGVATWSVFSTDGREFETAVGSRETVPLPDGSRIELNTDSRVHVAVSDSVRQVKLERGEAYFEIAKDPEHPFVVEAGDQRITVLGTKFSVRLDGAAVRVAVTEGRVRVESAELVSQRRAPVELVPGTMARTTGESVLVTTKTVGAVEEQLSWRTGFLFFRDVPLADAVADFNRYNQTKLVIEDPEVAKMAIGGSFRATNIDVFVQLLEDGFGVKAVRGQGRILLRRR